MASTTPPKPPKQGTDAPKEAGPTTSRPPVSQGDPRKVFNDFASI
ncbi:hypothetical protein [Roseovarius bejariae]|nr:hypothetical protein [Roseovarius bejariae]